MIKRILIPLDKTAYTDTAIEYGCYFAKKLDAELTGIAVLDIPGIEKSVGPVPAGASYSAWKLRQAKKQEETDLIKELLKNFKKKCKSEGVRHRESKDQGYPSEIIIQKAMFFDFMIVGIKTSYEYSTTSKPGPSFEKIIESSVTPILAVPDRYKPLDNCNPILAFNGSLPAARAMHRFTSLFAGNYAKMKLTVFSSEEDSEKANFHLDHAERYLKTHGFKDMKKVWSQKDKIDEFEEKYYLESDLFILGMHSKRIIADFFIGSLGKYILGKGAKPVLLGQ